MKKFLGIIVIAGSLVACNNSSEGTKTEDTTVTTVDTTNVNTNVTTVDTTHVMDTTHVVADTTKK